MPSFTNDNPLNSPPVVFCKLLFENGNSLKVLGICTVDFIAQLVSIVKNGTLCTTHNSLYLASVVCIRIITCIIQTLEVLVIWRLDEDIACIAVLCFSVPA